MSDMAEMTISGKLEIGVVYNGMRHRRFVLRLATVDDNIYALEHVGIDQDVELANVVARQMRMNTGMLSQQLVSLGGIPKEELTYEFLATNLAPADYDSLWEANQELKKKRNALPEFEETSGQSQPSSGNAQALPNPS